MRKAGTNRLWITSSEVISSRIGTSPAALNFGNVRLGATSSVMTITVKNMGASDLVIESIDITGTNASEFGQTNNCTTDYGRCFMRDQRNICVGAPRR